MHSSEAETSSTSCYLCHSPLQQPTLHTPLAAVGEPPTLFNNLCHSIMCHSQHSHTTARWLFKAQPPCVLQASYQHRPNTRVKQDSASTPTHPIAAAAELLPSCFDGLCPLGRLLLPAGQADTAGSPTAVLSGVPLLPHGWQHALASVGQRVSPTGCRLPAKLSPWTPHSTKPIKLNTN